MSKIQEMIKLRRNLLNMTQLELAESVGVREATINRYESGEIKNIKHDMIVKLSKSLKCSPEYLMGWSNELYPDYKTSAPKNEALVTNDVLTRALSELTDEELDDVLVFARFLKTQRDKK